MSWFDKEEKEFDTKMQLVYDRWQRGDRKEALILLERFFPKLVGIDKILD